MTVYRTRERATNQNELVEETRDRIILEHTDLQITVINLENPWGWKESALEREPYHTHSVDEITAKLQGMTVFTIVDFKKGYWMVVLHPDSGKLTCMALPFGRFQ